MTELSGNYRTVPTSFHWYHIVHIRDDIDHRLDLPHTVDPAMSFCKYHCFDKIRVRVTFMRVGVMNTPRYTP